MQDDLFTLLLALVVVLCLALLLRWVFAPSRPRTGRPVDAAVSTDLGLLRVLAAGLPRQQALEIRAVLGDAGIRSSMSARRDGRHDVLVFETDLDRARLLLAP